MKIKYLIVFLLLFGIGCNTNTSEVEKQEKIDRKAVVSRHHVKIHEVDTLNSLSLGNGEFAMTMDITGLQTFPVHYQKGIPLGTMSEWGWHSFPTDKEYKIEETLDSLESHGRKVPYARQWPSDTPEGEASNYLRQNPHRIHLANIGWHIVKSDGSAIDISDIKNIDQELDVWKGELISKFEVEGVTVEVVSIVGQDDDILGVKIKSTLLEQGRIGLNIKYPYPTNHFLDEAANYDVNEPKRLVYDSINVKNISISRKLDKTQYFTSVSSSLNIASKLPTDTGFIVKPNNTGDSWEFTVAFSESKENKEELDFNEFRNETNTSMETFWNSGGMIDFGEVKDSRAMELERRMILSLYLTKINCGGASPPQETGLTYNSWYGKPHMEMIWWHGMHYALWGRSAILEKQLTWYIRAEEIAKTMAVRQGFEGVRWQKMTDNIGGETSSSIGSYLIWQQPHIIYLAELIYSQNKDEQFFQKYAPLVEKTAEFMADFAWYDPELKQYILGPGVIAAQERFDPKVTYNPTFELAYWKWGLENAQKWRERAGGKRNEKWDEILNGLSPLPEKDGVYLAASSALDSYTTEKYMTDHPSVLGAYGMLPKIDGMNEETMRKTFDKILNDWHWEDTWGWDFPMAAMTATRLGHPDKAIETLLMSIETNTYLKNGHNYQNETLRLYLPGNGGLLAALALMATTTNDQSINTGFPESWNVKSEGLLKML